MKVILTKPYLPFHQRMIVTMPTGLLYLASYIRKHLPDVQVEIIDPDIFSGSFDDFVDVIKSKKPDIIGLTVFSHVIVSTKKLVSKIKTVIPEAVIIAGGSHINAVKQKAFIQLPQVDYAIICEGEKGFLELCKQILLNKTIVNNDAVPGLIYRIDSTVLHTPGMFTNDLSEFDPLDFSLIDLNAYFSFGSPMGLFRRGEHVAQIITTRGCPFACTFCASPINMGNKVRKRSTTGIINEIESVISLGADEIHIMDDNFTFDRDHVINLCKEIIKRRFNINFCMPNGVRLDKLDEEMLMWMKQAGWYHFAFGIEVGSDENLKKIRKGVKMSTIKEKIDLVKKIGFTTTGAFILGLPHDNLFTIRETAATPDRLGLDMASFGNFTPLPGTEIYNELVEKGEIDEEYLPSFSSGEVTYSPPGITTKQLVKLQRNIVLKYWIHPRRIKLILSRLKLRDITYVIRRLRLIIFRPPSA